MGYVSVGSRNCFVELSSIDLDFFPLAEDDTDSDAWEGAGAPVDDYMEDDPAEPTAPPPRPMSMPISLRGDQRATQAWEGRGSGLGPKPPAMGRPLQAPVSPPFLSDDDEDEVIVLSDEDDTDVAPRPPSQPPARSPPRPATLPPAAPAKAPAPAPSPIRPSSARKPIPIEEDEDDEVDDSAAATANWGVVAVRSARGVSHHDRRPPSAPTAPRSAAAAPIEVHSEDEDEDEQGLNAPPPRPPPVRPPATSAPVAPLVPSRRDAPTGATERPDVPAARRAVDSMRPASPPHPAPVRSLQATLETLTQKLSPPVPVPGPAAPRGEDPPPPTRTPGPPDPLSELANIAAHKKERERVGPRATAPGSSVPIATRREEAAAHVRTPGPQPPALSLAIEKETTAERSRQVAAAAGGPEAVKATQEAQSLRKRNSDVQVKLDATLQQLAAAEAEVVKVVQEREARARESAAREKEMDEMIRSLQAQLAGERERRAAAEAAAAAAAAAVPPVPAPGSLEHTIAVLRGDVAAAKEMIETFEGADATIRRLQEEHRQGELHLENRALADRLRAAEAQRSAAEARVRYLEEENRRLSSRAEANSFHGDRAAAPLSASPPPPPPPPPALPPAPAPTPAPAPAATPSIPLVPKAQQKKNHSNVNGAGQGERRRGPVINGAGGAGPAARMNSDMDAVAGGRTVYRPYAHPGGQAPPPAPEQYPSHYQGTAQQNVRVQGPGTGTGAGPISIPGLGHYPPSYGGPAPGLDGGLPLPLPLLPGVRLPQAQMPPGTMHM